MTNPLDLQELPDPAEESHEYAVHCISQFSRSEH